MAKKKDKPPPGWLVRCTTCNRVSPFKAQGEWRLPTSEESALAGFIDGLCPEHDTEPKRGEAA